MEIRVAKKEENKKVIRFLNKVFHKPFPRLIPSLYGKDKNMMEYHYLVEENGELVGGVCAYPEEITSCGITIKGVAIGMVATLKSARGKGVMTNMLKHVEDAVSNDADVMFLTGRRHRYEHFGYYPAGCLYSFEISNMSIKKWENGNPYTIVKAKSQEDFNKVDELNAFGEVVVSRPLATESETLRNWFSKLYLIKCGEEVVGFIGGKLFKGHTLERIFIKDGSACDYIYGVSAYKKYKGASVLKVEVLPTESALKSGMHACSEEYSVVSHEKFKVLSYKRLFEKLLLISVKQSKIEDFSKVIEIASREKLLLSVEGGNVRVEETDAPAQLIMTEEQAIASLLGQEESIVKGLVKIALRHSDFI